MEFSNIQLLLKEKAHTFIVLNEYDGVKEAIDVHNKILLSWFDEKDKYEEWLIIELDENIMKKYLSQQIGLLNTIKYSKKMKKIFLAKRYYDKYNYLVDIKKVDLDDIKDGLPLEDIPLDVNIYEILNDKYETLNDKNYFKDKTQIIILDNNYVVDSSFEYNQQYHKILNYQISTKSEKYIENNNESLLPIAA